MVRRCVVAVSDAALRLWIARTRVAREAGQTVAEYALVLLVAAVIAGAFLLWARQSGRLDAFFDGVFARLLESVESSPPPDPTPAP